MHVLYNGIKTVLIVSLLTILTQVGGLVYLLYKPLGFRLKKRIPNKWASRGYRFLSFTMFMLVFSILIIPPIAKQFGRVPLPLFSSTEIPLKPANLLLCFANRHYVHPELKKATIQIAKALQLHDAAARLIYLDANFPFIANFPLLPHLSHDDGEKLDLGFLYRHPKSKQLQKNAPTSLGYGFCEKPQKGEKDQPALCAKSGNWQYSLLTKLTRPKPAYQFDASANKALLQIIVRNKSIGKVLLEPHLKTRLGFSQVNKIRYHGCHAVRHDDHIHIQL